MDEETETDRKKKEKRIDLSVAQVAGSALAAAVAAYLAGQLGVYGTIIGAGLVSVVATTGGSIFQHLFRRTGEQIKEATVTTRPKPRRFPSTDPRSTTGTAARAQRTMVLPTFDGRGAQDDVTAVAARTAGPATDRTRPLPQAAQAYRRGRSADRTQLVPRLDERTGGGRPEEVSTTTYGTRLRGWKRPALGALAVFVLAMGGVTATELVTQQTPDGQKGTTLSNLISSGGRHQPSGPKAPDPGRSTGSDTHGRTGGPTPDPSGSGSTGGESGRGAQSPTPTPSDGGKSSPDPGTSPSTGPSPGHSSDGGGETGGSDGGSADGQGQGGQTGPDGAGEQQAPQPDAS
ncbi:hypothetical protein T261_2172 [Streptomyces lydicus]|nr:hypothetical protein T261_2172 [Streptomyces lydicus]